MPTLQVLHDSSDISDYILSYARDIDICTGVGTLTIKVPVSYSTTFTPWDEIEVYEDGSKVGTFNAGKIDYDANTGERTVFAQDNSKRLVDNFISEQYNINDYTTTKTWIQNFLSACGVSYQFNVSGSGPPISRNTSLGVESAYELVVRLLQMSGWYMYFNGNGTCIIDNVEASLSSWEARLTDDEIIEIARSKHDKMLRNRAVVWGGTDIGSTSRVFADLSRTTTWNYDNQDKRAILFANGDIATSTEAQDLAYTLLEEFARIEDEKVIKLAGFQGLNVGDTVLIRSQHYDGLGFISVLHVEASDNGYITTITIDKRCPRLFGYWGWGQGVGDDSGEVFVGTNGFGVWKKARGSQWWSDFSDGIGDLYIKDLAVANGLYACVTVNGYMYTRTVDMSYWSVVSYGEFEDEVVGGTYEAYPIACAINRATSEIYGLFTNGERGWVGIIQDNYVIGAQQVRLGDRTLLVTFDMDTDDNRAYVTVGTTAAVSPVFQNNPFPVIDAFTRNTVTGYQKFGFTDAGEFEGDCSDIVWGLGEVSYAQLEEVLYPEHATLHESIRFRKFDFSDDDIIETTSPFIYCSGGYSSPGVPWLYYSPGKPAVDAAGNFYLWRGNDRIYKYVWGDDHVTELPYGGDYSKYWRVYNGVGFRYYRSGLEYIIDWFDITTGASGSTKWADVPGVYDTEYFGGIVYAKAFNKIFFHTWYAGDMDNPATDNAYDGITPDIAYGVQTWIIIGIFDLASKSVICSRARLIHPNSTLEASDSDATGHSTSLSDKVSLFWSSMHYEDGLPMLYGQYTLADNGPWVYTGGNPPYVLQGSRYEGEEDNEYPRTFTYDPINDILLPATADYNTTMYSPGNVYPHIQLSNTWDNMYWTWYQTAGIPTLYAGGWRTPQGEMTPNYMMSHWVITSEGEQNKHDYNDGYFVIFGGYKYGNTSVKYDIRLYDPTEVMPAPSSGYSQLIPWFITYQDWDDYNNCGGNKYLEQQASQNVLAGYWQRTYWRDPFNPFNCDSGYTWHFARFGEWSNYIENAVYATTMSTTSGFEIIDMTTSPHRLEVAPSGPIVTFPYQDDSSLIPASGFEYAEGGLRIGLLASGLGLPISGWSFGEMFPSGFLPEFHFYTPPAPEGEYTVIMDARPFSMNPASELMVTSGILTISGVYIPSGIMNVGILMTDKVWIRNAYDSDSVSGWSVLVTLSGEYVSKFETTNHFDPPYFFVSTAPGLVQSGYVTNPSGYLNFYERHVGSSWSNYTAGLPSGYITVIRCDDLL